MSAAINLNQILENAIALSREHSEWTAEQIIADLLEKNVPVDEIKPAAKSAKTTKAVKSAKNETDDGAEKKERIRSAPAKPRAIPEDDARCCARSFYEKDHLDGAILKVMRDDSANLYGDRCKFKKTGDAEFCKHHSEKQPLGIWGAEYSGKFKAYVEKTESDSESEAVAEKPKPAKKTPAPKKPEPKVEVEEAVADDEEEVVEEPAAPAPVAAPKKAEEPAPAPAPKKPAPKVEEPAADDDSAEVEECTIDGKSYLKEADGTIYDAETEDVVGKYNFKTKKWISGPKH